MKSTVTNEVATFRAAQTPKDFNPAEWFVVCPWGTVETRKGPVTVNERTLAVFEANQKALRRDAVAGDFEHNTLRGVEPTPVTGYYSARVTRGVGIEAKLNHATPDLEMVKAGHYPDISPAVERDERGVVQSLHSFAFCRHGEISHPDLEIFSVEVSVEVDGSGDAGGQPKTQPKAHIMSDAEMLAELLSALTGETIAPDASPETKAAALAKAKTAMTAKPAEMSAGSPDKITALSAAVNELKSKITALAAKDGERSVDLLIAEAQTRGKKIGLSRDRLVAMGAEGAKEYLDSLEAGVVIPDGRNNPATASPKSKSGDKPTDVFSADTIAMWKRQGIDPQDMLKRHNERAAAAGTEAEGDE